MPLAVAAAVTATRPGTYPSPASPLCCQQVAYCARHKKARIGAKGRKSGLQKNEGNVVVVVGTMADSAIVSGPFIKYLTTMTTMRGLSVCLSVCLSLGLATHSLASHPRGKCIHRMIVCKCEIFRPFSHSRPRPIPDSSGRELSEAAEERERGR